MILSTAVRRFDTQLQADGKSDHTRGAYMRDLRDFGDWLSSSTDVRSITPSRVARYVVQCSKGSPAISLNRTKTALRMFFKFLTDAGYIDANPARLIKNARCEQKIPEHLTTTEVKKLLGTIPLKDGPVAKRDRIMIALLLETGIRLGSLCQLMAGDVRLGERVLKINGKGGTDQSVYLNSSIRRLLRSYIRSSNLAPDDPLFPSRNRRQLGRRQVQLRFHHWLAKAGIKRHLTVHSTRHTFALRLFRQTGNLRLVQTALGHRHISTTEIYARVEDKALRRALEKL